MAHNQQAQATWCDRHEHLRIRTCTPATATHTQRVTGQLRAHTRTGREGTMLDGHSTTGITVNCSIGGNRCGQEDKHVQHVQHLHNEKPAPQGQPTQHEPPWPHTRLLEVMHLEKRVDIWHNALRCILVPASVWALAVT